MLPMHHDKSLYLVHGINSTPFPTVHSEFRTFHGHTYKHVSSMIENGARGSKAEGSVHRVYQDIAACQYIRPFRAAFISCKRWRALPSSSLHVEYNHNDMLCLYHCAVCDLEFINPQSIRTPFNIYFLLFYFTNLKNRFNFFQRHRSEDAKQ